MTVTVLTGVVVVVDTPLLVVVTVSVLELHISKIFKLEWHLRTYITS